MASRQFTITLTPELAQALDGLVARRKEERSRLIETLLRENPYVQEAVQDVRRAPQLRKGRDPADFARLVESARQTWKRRLESGQVKFPEPR